MSALLELIKEAPPEDRQAVAEFLKPYLQPIEIKPKVEHLLTVKEFQEQLPVRKRADWIRNDLFCQNPELKQFAFNLNAGKGHKLKISPKALDWVADHADEINWKG